MNKNKWLLLALMSVNAHAATYTELAQRGMQAVAYTPPVNYAQVAPTGYYGMANRYPASPNTAMGMLPVGANGYPNAQQIRWSYGQVNAASDAFNAFGLSTQGMFVPWSTPMSAWSNAQQWDWWRNRAGDAGPPPPLW
ncbi:MAG: hypothetical protein HOP20_10435 [Sulfuriferula sp.]|nr:hypothetical protein [Sulfuriferula sp.]